jgi:hypothetical protein
MDFPEVEKPKNQPLSAPPLQPSSKSPLLRFFLLIFVGCPMLCCLVGCVCVGLVTVFAGVSEHNRVTERSNEVLEVSDPDNVTLEVTNEVGQTRIRGTEDTNQIEVEIVKSATGFSRDDARATLNQLDVVVEKDGDRYLITVTDRDDSGNPFSDASVDLLITVPRSLNLIITSEVGEMSVRDVNIRDQLQLTSDVGKIEFEGTIGPEGEHRITSNVGEIDIEVSADSSFRLDASTDVGEIEVDLDLASPINSQDGPTHSVTGIYGNASTNATLTLRTDVGKITLDD